MGSQVYDTVWEGVGENSLSQVKKEIMHAVILHTHTQMFSTHGGILEIKWLKLY